MPAKHHIVRELLDPLIQPDFILSEFLQMDFQQLREHMARLERLGTPEWRMSIPAVHP